MKHPIVYFLSSSRLAIETAMKKKAILEKLKKVGYDLSKLKEGKALNEKATIMQMLSNDKWDESIAQKPSKHYEVTQQAYTKHLQLARLTFHGNPEMNQSLMLSEISGLSEHWLDRANKFYTILFEREVDVYGLTKEEVLQMKTEVQALLENRNKEMSVKDNTLNNLDQKNLAFNELEQWMHHYRDAAFLALKDNEQLLEELGFRKSVSQ